MLETKTNSVGNVFLEKCDERFYEGYSLFSFVYIDILKNDGGKVVHTDEYGKYRLWNIKLKE